MCNRRKNLFFVGLFLCINFYGINSIQKPKIIIGLNSNQNLKKEDEFNYLYPYGMSDLFYASIEEKISNFFTIKYLVNIGYSQYNKIATNFSYLKKINLKNYLYLSFKFSQNSKFLHAFKLILSPQYNSYAGENYYKMYNFLSYSVSLKKFKMQYQYSNQFTLREKETFKHKISFIFYWSLPKYDFIKFKGYLSLYFEHGLYEKLNIFPLTKASVKFEIAFDFNRKSFEELFLNQIEQDIDSD